MSAFRSFPNQNVCKPTAARPRGRGHVERCHVMKHALRLGALLLAAAIIPAGAAEAATGGAGLIAPGTPHGIVNAGRSAAVFNRTLRKGQRGVECAHSRRG